MLAVSRDIVPPTINYQTPDPACGLDCVPNKARELPVRVALSNSFGFGGHNAALIMRKLVDGLEHEPKKQRGAAEKHDASVAS